MTVSEGRVAHPLSPDDPGHRRLRRPRGPRLEQVAVVLAVLITVIAFIGPWLAPHDPYLVDLPNALQPPSRGNLLGTDVNGRDVLSRILAGGRLTLLATFVVLVVATTVGTLVGTTAALSRRLVDEVLMRICDIGLSIPPIILALGLAAALGPSLNSAVIALAATWWPGYARLVRTVVRDVRDAEFVDSARSVGVSQARLIFRHILPNSLNVLYVQVTLDVASVMLVISGLSFVGVGAQVPSAEWGATIAASATNVVNGWWALVFPGLMIGLTAVTFNIAGDWLRVRNDPTLRTERS